ncbi:phage holin family protein [Novosphingobium sp. KCTC 2891]|uniref:phage holin family protein n=1 Tax=Novosphingobium sp. KCTC 2891 TaxID=2989730 RepID=UPI002222BFFC|nr:phage holin family protein [Novosphingobium sp. KCTC 2891]MCW1381807.1 phage holin family protein [Novosphingobium sp. KCTC 2891]
MKSETSAAAAGHAASDASLGDGIRALLEDGQTLFEAEVAFQQARVGYALGRAKGIALLLVAALFLAFFTLVALVVGLLLALIPLLGAWGALAVVGLGLALSAALCFFSAVSRFRKARAVILDTEGGA